MRAVYDEIKGYSVSAINPFLDTSEEREYAFVDEFTCIGKPAGTREQAVTQGVAVTRKPAVTQEPAVMWGPAVIWGQQ